mgnify:CR=1 FL=1
MVRVFPTPVGVFLAPTEYHAELVRLPHARGGVSAGFRIQQSVALSSPRPWGCFYPAYYGVYPYFVFPTPVGVFPLPLKT